MGSLEHGPFHFELNTGARMPSVGLGTWKVSPGMVGDAVIAAVKAGYRHFDCARVYENEKEVGDALNHLISTGMVKRSDLWITSKLWCSDYSPEDVSRALSKTLQDLQLDYLDLYLMHWPIRTKPGSRGFEAEVMLPLCLCDTWGAMEGLYASGQARAIGVSNFSTKKLQNLLAIAKVPPAVNQVECHPVWQQPELHNFCRSTGIHLSAYSPLGSPGTWVKGEILIEPALIEIAEKLNKTPAQVALRWGIQSGHSVLPKSTNESRVKENLDVFNWCIPQDLFAKFSDIKQEDASSLAPWILIQESPSRFCSRLMDAPPDWRGSSEVILRSMRQALTEVLKNFGMVKYELGYVGLLLHSSRDRDMAGCSPDLLSHRAGYMELRHTTSSISGNFLTSFSLLPDWIVIRGQSSEGHTLSTQVS